MTGNPRMAQRHDHRGGLGLVLLAWFLLAGCGGSPPNPGAAAAPSDAIVRTAEKGPVKLRIQVWPREPRLSDLVEMEILVEAEADVEVSPPAFGQAVGDFLVRDYSERPAERNAANTRRFHYQLEPVQAGKHLIRSVAIRFTDRRDGSESGGEPVLLESDPLEIVVTSELGTDAPDLADLEPMLTPEELPGVSRIPWWIGGAVAAVLAVLAARFLRGRGGREPEPPRQSPEEVAHAALASLLLEELPRRGLFKEFYLRLTGIVRRYIEDTTGIQAYEQTTEEFLRAMRSRALFSPQRSNRLAEFLEAADMVKYAGQEPQAGQVDEATLRAREFIGTNREQSGRSEPGNLERVSAT